MKRINMRIRFKNPTFWLGFIPALLSLAYTIVANFTNIMPPISENEAVRLATTVISLLTAVGVLVDPTSKGIGDCPHCLNLSDPEE